MVHNLKIITNESGETRNKVIFIKHMYHMKAHFMLSIYFNAMFGMYNSNYMLMQ